MQILQQTKSSMQSGPGKGVWVIRCIDEESESTSHKRYVSSPMQWIGIKDTKYQLKLEFSTLAAAERYANTHGIEYEVLFPTPRKHIRKAYADNFK